MTAWKSKTTEVQTLLFPKSIWNRKSASAWVKKHGFKTSKVDITEDHFRYRQQEPILFQPKSFRTIALKKGPKPIKAVIGRPWVIVGNPRSALFEVIHRDWKLHRKKHELYAQLARQKGTGKYTLQEAKRKFKPLVIEAARVYRREHKIKPKLSVVFPIKRIDQGVKALVKEFSDYWKKGQLDQYLPKKAWRKRQEK